MFSSKRKSTPHGEKIQLTSDYAEKLVALEMMKRVENSLEKRLEKRENDFFAEKKKLETLHQQIWNSMDGFCESIWKFSAGHDFAEVINNYLDRPLTESLKKTEEDPEKIQYLQYQINLLTEEIKSLQENIKSLDLDKKPTESTSPSDNKQKAPLRESPNNQQQKIEEKPKKTQTDTKKSNSLEKMKKVTFQDDSKKTAKPSQNSKFELTEKPLESIFKTPEDQKINLGQRNSTFSLKRKSKICEKFQKNLN